VAVRKKGIRLGWVLFFRDFFRERLEPRPAATVGEFAREGS
jgi:hypothetical protein